MQDSDDTTWMQLALELAKETKAQGELPFGAVIVKDGVVIGQGSCQEKTDNNVTSHAELLAVDKACRALGTNLEGATIYCTNEPCLMCSGAIFQAKIGRVVIGASRNDLSTLLRSRKLSINDVANDSGYDISLEFGIERRKVLELFENISRTM